MWRVRMLWRGLCIILGGGSKRGWFLIEEGKVNMGLGWDGVVLLSGMAVLEYMRKMSGWSY